MSPIDKKTIQEFWTKNVPGWDIVSKKFTPEEKEFYEEVDTYRYKYDSYITSLIDSFARKGRSILEIGCGLGSDSRYIAKKGANIISLDLSPNNVFLATKGMRLFGFNPKGVCADAEHLPFKDNSFDIVYSFGVLHHTPDTQRALNEVNRILKHNGQCIIMLYHKGYAYYALLLCYSWRILFFRYNRVNLMNRYDRTPLSKLYSKEEIYQLFQQFKDLDLEITTYGGIQIHPVLKFIYKILHKSKFLMRNFGSYIIIKGRK